MIQVSAYCDDTREVSLLSYRPVVSGSILARLRRKALALIGEI